MIILSFKVVQAFVFNIRGNAFRLVALIHFNKRTLYIRFIGTHAKYDKINCSTL